MEQEIIIAAPVINIKASSGSPDTDWDQQGQTQLWTMKAPLSADMRYIRVKTDWLTGRTQEMKGRRVWRFLVNTI